MLLMFATWNGEVKIFFYTVVRFRVSVGVWVSVGVKISAGVRSDIGQHFLYKIN